MVYLFYSFFLLLLYISTKLIYFFLLGSILLEMIKNLFNHRCFGNKFNWFFYSMPPTLGLEHLISYCSNSPTIILICFSSHPLFITPKYFLILFSTVTCLNIYIGNFFLNLFLYLKSLSEVFFSFLEEKHLEISLLIVCSVDFSSLSFYHLSIFIIYKTPV